MKRYIYNVVLITFFLLLAASGAQAVSIWGASDRAPAVGTMRLPVDTSSGSSPGYLEVSDVSDYTLAADGEIASLAGLTSAANSCPYYTGSGTAALYTCTSYGRSLLNVADEAAFKALINAEAGVDFQAYDADLTTYAGITPSANVQTILSAADYAAIRTALGLVIGTNVQAYSADTAFRTDKLSVFAATTSAELAGVISNETGSGLLVYGTKPTITFANTGLTVRDTDDTHELSIVPGSNLTAAHTLTVTTGDADRTLTLNGNTTLSGTNTGDQTITLTGDVTGSGTGSFAATIANSAVTLAKMADIATDRLIGRDTAGTGVPEALTVGGGVEFTGSGGIQRSALTGDVTASAGSASTTIANDAVTYAKMQNVSATDKLLGRVSAGSGDVEEVTFTDLAQSLVDDTTVAAMHTTLGIKQEYCVAMSDQTTALTTGTGKANLYLPAAATVTAVRAYLVTAATGGTLLTVDINEAGTTILSTKITTDASEKTSGTAATAAVISDTAIAANAEITFDIDAVGSTIAGAGLVACLQVTM